MTAREKVRAIHALALKGYWIAKTRSARARHHHTQREGGGVVREEMKRGDRVRVTFEGVLTQFGDSSLSVETDGGDSRWFSKQSYSHDTFQIERIEPPLKVGEAVQWNDGVQYHIQGHIVHIDGPRAWVLSGLHDSIQALSDLERIA